MDGEPARLLHEIEGLQAHDCRTDGERTVSLPDQQVKEIDETRSRRKGRRTPDQERERAPLVAASRGAPPPPLRVSAERTAGRTSARPFRDRQGNKAPRKNAPEGVMARIVAKCATRRQSNRSFFWHKKCHFFLDALTRGENTTCRRPHVLSENENLMRNSFPLSIPRNSCNSWKFVDSPPRPCPHVIGGLSTRHFTK